MTSRKDENWFGNKKGAICPLFYSSFLRNNIYHRIQQVLLNTTSSLAYFSNCFMIILNTKNANAMYIARFLILSQTDSFST